MPRAPKATVQARPAPKVEEEQAPVGPIVEPEVPFGADPDDAMDAEPAPVVAKSAGPEVVSVVFRGTRPADVLQPVAITVTVPDDGSKYDDLITSGHTYTLRLNKPVRVEKADARWLTRHPTFVIEKQP